MQNYIFCVVWVSGKHFRMTIFRAVHEWVGVKKAPLHNICHTYPTVLKLDKVIPYLRKIQEVYESRDTPLEFCWY